MEVVTKSARETQKLGEKLANSLKGGSIIALFGDLGSGKTTFVKGLAKGLGIKERILSPTFVLIRQYLAINHQPSIINFYHVDLYRIEAVEEVKGIGLEEIFTDEKGIVAIEWAEKIKTILPKKRIEVYFEYAGEKQRKIEIND